MAKDKRSESFTGFIDRLTSKSRPRNDAILTVCWRVTALCNIKCRHCIYRRDKAVHELAASSKKVDAILKGLLKLGVLRVHLTGGEPFLKKDFWDLYLKIRSKGFLVSIGTNATALRPDDIANLAKYPPIQVCITLYGGNDKDYEIFCGARNGFSRLERNIKALERIGMPLYFVTHLTKLTARSYGAIKKLTGSTKNIGSEIMQSDICGHQQRRSGYADRFLLKPAEFIDLALEHGEVLDDIACVGGYERSGYPQCLCKICGETLSIEPDGRMYFCNYFSSHPGFRELNTGSSDPSGIRKAGIAIIKKLKYNRQCAGCDIVQFCNSCPGTSFIETGDPRAKVDRFCEMAHFRKAVYDILNRKKRAHRKNAKT